MTLSTFPGKIKNLSFISFYLKFETIMKSSVNTWCGSTPALTPSAGPLGRAVIKLYWKCYTLYEEKLPKTNKQTNTPVIIKEVCYQVVHMHM